MWVKGSIKTPAGSVSVISTSITPAEKWEHIMSRTSAYRNTYTVEPGLYAVGMPGEDSEVLVSANYKLSFDHLRQSIGGLDAWVLVLDTKGINVWCAAGKGTFATGELVARVGSSGLGKVVSHRRLVLPQLGAVGISAHEVKKSTGFRVHYGPVYARDVRAYIEAGLSATSEMRRVRFTFMDRLVLTPMEIIPAMRYLKWFALGFLVLFGLMPDGIMFNSAISGGLPMVGMFLLSVLSGALLTPALLPYIPFRSFAIKGFIMGLPVTYLGMHWLLNGMHPTVMAASWVWVPLMSSYIALQFTGSTTYTGMSGVEKELRLGVPVYIGASVISAMLLLAYKVIEWRAIS